jgi:hypothetical protein
MSPLRLAIATVVLALTGCLREGDHPIHEIIALRSRGGGAVEVCAEYDHWNENPGEGETTNRHTRIIDVDASGRQRDRSGTCSAVASDGTHVALGDGGQVDFRALDAMLTRTDAGGTVLWTAPSPFGVLQATAEEPGVFLFLGDGPEVARLALADGSVAWVVELR